MFMKRLLGVAVTGAVMSLGIAGGAGATPYLQILDGGAPAVPPPGNVCPGHPADVNHCEVIGDRGGTIYPWLGGGGGGAGIPSQNAGWPVGPGFATDPSSGNLLGTTGWHASYLKLTESASVTFQFMGGGDSTFDNSFWVDLNGAAADGWTQLFKDHTTPPCAVGPGTNPNCNAAGGPLTQNQYTFFFDIGQFPEGLIPFAFDIQETSGGPVLAGPINQRNGAWNWHGLPPALANCTGNPESVTEVNGCPGFFLGADPYLVTGPFQSNNLRAVYAGLTDRGGDFDHDFQDMGVRISVVPEPGSLALLGLALGGLALSRRRKGANA